MDAYVNDSGINFAELTAAAAADVPADEPKTTKRGKKSKPAESTPRPSAALDKALAKAAKAAKAPADEPEADSEEERAELRIVIRRFYSSKRFRDDLKEVGMLRTPAQLDKMTNAQLKEHLSALGFTCNNRVASKNIRNMCRVGLTLVETGLRTRYNCDGLVANLEGIESADGTVIRPGSDEYLDCLELLQLENPSLFRIPTPMRLGIIVTQAIYQTHAFNEHARRMRQMRGELPPDAVAADEPAVE